MKIETKDIPFLFETTQISDIFFSDYLQELSGNCIKIYLYMVYLSKHKNSIKLNDLSRSLNIQINEINECVNMLEEKNLILKSTSGYIIQNIQEIALNKLYKPNMQLSEEKVQEIKDSKIKQKAIEHINNSYFHGVMSPTWFQDINNLFNRYNFDDQVIIALFDYCYNKSALNRNYLLKVAEVWGMHKIRNWSDLDDFFQKQEKFKVIKKQIMKKLNKYSITQYEEAYIDKWVNEFSYDISIIEIALKRSTFKQNITFEYLNTLITSWHEQGLKTVPEIEQFIQTSKEQKSKTKIIKETISKMNYAQRPYTDFDMYYANNPE